ncbi:conserved hypothetical protein [Leishmania major strain Friedlin]|uniref:Band 7 domain-containing protein n=1 Tax=Leishmania major TaxID=5664 RepID=E9ABZ7_LEIMA|nr:conserved hypothetical protein [Leishmania major strain Friedlin]CAG9567071.1 hypothetical_protein_-_conserved [Leishmania major strain Friedlin]CBZ11811.1 conserved hypothetical protein [Leishmania major strain Friedlin]|eukprot:XP_003721528.1 conserved hypothetical protein [Leishmania major strain Friedlin]
MPDASSTTVVAAPPAKERSGSSGGVLLPLTVAGAGLLCLWKAFQICSVPVHPRCVTVVYDTRRKTVLCTSADREMRRGSLPRVSHFNVSMYFGSALMYWSGTRLLVPPSSFFGVFTLPRSVLEEPGESVNCAVEEVAVRDGTVNMMVTVFYTIPFDQVERYLAAVGPEPPNEVIGKAVAHIARVRCAEQSAGILLSKTRREAFMGPYKDHLTSKLMSEAAVLVRDVAVENVVLLEGG